MFKMGKEMQRISCCLIFRFRMVPAERISHSLTLSSPLDMETNMATDKQMRHMETKQTDDCNTISLSLSLSLE